MKILGISLLVAIATLCLSQDVTTQTKISASRLPGTRSVEDYQGANPADKIRAADADCKGSTCVIGISPTVGPGNPAKTSDTSTFLDFRPKVHASNPVHSGFNITDGRDASDWMSNNTGGLPRSKLYVGSSPSSIAFPGDVSALFLMNAANGVYPGAKQSTVDETIGVILQTQANTDTLTNATVGSPLASIVQENNLSLIGTGLQLWDLRALTASIFSGTPTGQGSAGTAVVLDGQGLEALPAHGFHVGKAVTVYAESPGLNVANQNTYRGTVTTDGNTVAWAGGDKFYGNVIPTLPININGVNYLIASVQSPTQLTLASSAGFQSRPVNYSITGLQYSLLAEGNVRISPRHNTYPTPDPQGGGGFIVDTESGGGPNTMMWIRDLSGLGPDGTYNRKGIRVGNGSSQDLQILDRTGTKVLLAISDAGNATVAQNLRVNGMLTKGGGSFKIDHPLDPANKYLSHSFVESPDMKNIYDGIAVLDERGEAEIPLPDWFQALNRDFRYQLTCLGQFAPVYIAEEIQQNRFRIAGGSPGMKVSWQVTGIRQDAFANAHRVPVEEEKPPAERGHYLHPELFKSAGQ